MIACVDLPATGQRIKTLMSEAGIGVSELTDLVAVTQQAISKWIHGQSLPSVDNLVILADIFKVKVDDILVIYHV